VIALSALTRRTALKAQTMKRLLLLLYLFLPLLTYTQDKLEEHWHSLLLEGKTVGFLHQTTWQTGEDRLRSEIEQTMEIRRFGVPFFMTQTDVWIEEGDGKLVSVSSQLDMNGQPQRVEARIAEGELRIQLRRRGETDEILLPLEGEPRGVSAVGREIAAVILNSSGRAEMDYRLFCPETMKIEEFRLRVLGPGELKDSLGRIHRGILVEERTSGLPGCSPPRSTMNRPSSSTPKRPWGWNWRSSAWRGTPVQGGAGRPPAASRRRRSLRCSM